MLKARWLAVCCVALFGAALSATPRPVGEAPKAATPEAALKGFAAALEAGNVPAARAYLAPPLDAVWAGEFEFWQAGVSFGEALDKKFGKGPRPFVTWKALAEKHVGVVRSVEMLGKDRARLTVWSTPTGTEDRAIYESTLEAVRADGGWKLHLPLPESVLGGPELFKK